MSPAGVKAPWGCALANGTLTAHANRRIRVAGLLPFSAPCLWFVRMVWYEDRHIPIMVEVRPASAAGARHQGVTTGLSQRLRFVEKKGYPQSQWRTCRATVKQSAMSWIGCCRALVLYTASAPRSSSGFWSKDNWKAGQAS